MTDQPTPSARARELVAGAYDTHVHVSGTTGSLLFELIDSADIDRRLFAVATATDRLMQEAEDWVLEYGWPARPDN